MLEQVQRRAVKGPEGKSYEELTKDKESRGKGYWYWQHTFTHPKMHNTCTDFSAKVKLNSPPLTACPNYMLCRNTFWQLKLSKEISPLTAAQTVWFCTHGTDYKTKASISHEGCWYLIIYTHRLTAIIKWCKQCNCYHPIVCAQSCMAFILCDQSEMLTCR